MEPIHEFTLTRLLSAPPELVWEAWTREEHVAARWGPAGFTNPVCRWKPAPGEPISIHMQTGDGAIRKMSGQFLEVVPPQKLVFMTAALNANDDPMIEIRNTVTFAKVGTGTRITVHTQLIKARPEALAYARLMDAGWEQSMDKLQERLQQLV